MNNHDQNQKEGRQEDQTHQGENVDFQIANNFVHGIIRDGEAGQQQGNDYIAAAQLMNRVQKHRGHPVFRTKQTKHDAEQHSNEICAEDSADIIRAQ